MVKGQVKVGPEAGISGSWLGNDVAGAVGNAQQIAAGHALAQGDADRFEMSIGGAIAIWVG
jgi:hypothetical protein